MIPETFFFDSYHFDAATCRLDLSYSYEGGTAFVETITFPPITRALTDEDHRAIDLACRLIFLLAGVSYYKAFVPPQLACKAFALDKSTAAFVEKVYRKGLGEFSYQNKLDLRDRVHFVTTDDAPPAAAQPVLENALCVPVGGGKDSVVSIETLKQSKKPMSLFVLTSRAGVAAPIQACVDQSGLSAAVVTRQLSPALLELNKSGAYNGHVPITAILSAIAVATAVMQGWDTVVMSNEHSASAPNLQYLDAEVNHQYSKSLDFEADFAAYVTAHVARNISYFSFLRPLTEVAITKRFAQFENYQSVFRSCNTAFRQDGQQRNKNWCCDCPKCRFVFLALAPFIPPARMAEIFGTDMLRDPAQMEGFAHLCELGGHKPFECVGEAAESVLLFRQLALMPAWQDAAVVAHIMAQLPPVTDFDTQYADLFSLRPDHLVPDEYIGLLDENS